MTKYPVFRILLVMYYTNWSVVRQEYSKTISMKRISIPDSRLFSMVYCAFMCFFLVCKSHIKNILLLFSKFSINIWPVANALINEWVNTCECLKAKSYENYVVTTIDRLNMNRIKVLFHWGVSVSPLNMGRVCPLPKNRAFERINS